MAAVDGRQAVKTGGKSCVILVLTSKTHHLIILRVILCLFSGRIVDILTP